MTGNKLHSNQQWPLKTVMRQIWRVILKGGGGSPSLEGGMTPLNNLFGKNITWTDKVTVIDNSEEFIWIFAVDNSINAYLTEK